MSDPTPPERPEGLPEAFRDVAPTEPTNSPAKPAPREAYQAAGRVSPLGYLFFGGVAALIAGLVWRYVEKESSVVTDGFIFVALLAMLVPIAWHAVDFGRSVASRRGQAFGYVVTTTVLGFVVVGFVGWADVKFKTRLPTLDLTKSARYSLSEESSALLKKIDGTVYVTYLMQGQTDEGVRQAVIEQMHVYETASPSHVRVAEADSFREPDEAKRVLQRQGVTTTPQSGEDTDVVVLTYAEPGREVAPGKQKEIKVEEWTFFKRSSTGEQKWLGESVLSSGIYELVFQKLKAYATAGHGERLLSKEFHGFKDVVSAQNLEIASEPLTLGTPPRVPADCDLLFVTHPQAPFSPDEAAAIQKWLDAGSHALFLVVDLHEDRFTTGLDKSVLDDFGLHTHCNYEVVAPLLERMEINKEQALVPVGQMASTFPVYGTSYADHPAAAALRAHATIATFFHKATYVEADEKPPEGAEPQVVCYAPESPGVPPPVALRHDPSRKDYNSFKDGVDKSGPKLALVATSSRKVAGGKDSRVVLCGDSDVFSDALVEEKPANLELARGLVQWSVRREGLVSVSARTLDDPTVTPTEYQRRFALGWPLFACFLPLVVGGIVWWSRRR